MSLPHLGFSQGFSPACEKQKPILDDHPDLELNALALANRDLSNWFEALKSDHDALTVKVKEQRKLLTLALMALECYLEPTQSPQLTQWAIDEIREALK